MVSEYMNMDEVVAMAPRFEPEGWQRSSGMYQYKIATIYDVTRIICLSHVSGADGWLPCTSSMSRIELNFVE